MNGWCTHWSKKTCAANAAWPLKSAAFSLSDLAANFSAFGNNREKTGTYNEYCTIPKYPKPNDAKAALRFQSIFSRRSTKTCTTRSLTDVFAQLNDQGTQSRKVTPITFEEVPLHTRISILLIVADIGEGIQRARPGKYEKMCQEI